MELVAIGRQALCLSVTLMELASLPQGFLTLSYAPTI